MKQRTGKECKRPSCVHYPTYIRWFENLGSTSHTVCMNCRNAHVSQYKKPEDKP